MTKQEIFNKVYTHLMAQGRRAMQVSPYGVEYCMYRAPDGGKCAIGCLIPDEMYSERMENRPVSGMLTDFKDVGALLDRENNRAFLSRLQRVHDEHQPDEWKGALYTLAGQYGLEVPDGTP